MHDKYKSKTFELPSKIQLKANRDSVWMGLLFQNGLDIQKVTWWPQAEKDLEQQLWAKADADYEQRKAELKQQLQSLSPEERAIYWQEIGIEPQSLDDWL